MCVKIAIYCIIISTFIPLSSYSQTETVNNIPEGKLFTNASNIPEVVDTIPWVDDKVVNKSLQGISDNLNSKIFKPNPNKAVLYSAIFPGLGQIYNRKYWKLPIIYGGFVGLFYAITWNGRNYNDYTDAYKAIMSDNPTSAENRHKWDYFLPSQTDISKLSDSELQTWQSYFKRRRNYFRRNRDLSIIGAVALYALCMVDAYVDAQLFDFDISPDLSFHIEPKIELDAFSQKSFGLQCNIKF